MDYAVVQLRQDDKEGKLYNIVGFQTNLKFGEQKEFFYDTRFRKCRIYKIWSNA